ncbi:hypothetical protein N1851_015081 [Merluccius polli]|uniref:Uncharacterized protein n=1 Tax=Merluccius polli TaxID=89951 RepID=A0AA47P2I1_MERPO|nr:hypothetical protein N1851_015081 [Merluccius polli]
MSRVYSVRSQSRVYSVRSQSRVYSVRSLLDFSYLKLCVFLRCSQMRWQCKVCGFRATTRGDLPFNPFNIRFKHLCFHIQLLQDSVHSSVERTREVVLKCLIEYLGEQGGHLIKEFNDTENLEELEQLVMAIIVTPKPGASTSNSPKNIGIVIEGVEVITGLGDIARACSVLLGLTYALNLDYPTQLKYTFEVFQKLFLELDDSKLSNKVQSLKSKLLA